MVETDTATVAYEKPRNLNLLNNFLEYLGEYPKPYGITISTIFILES
jgi:hypothetical protein